MPRHQFIVTGLGPPSLSSFGRASASAWNVYSEASGVKIIKMVEAKDKFTPHLAGDAKSQTENKKSLKSGSLEQSAGFIQTTGRRKTAVARVRLIDGSGNVIVNDKNAEEYFSDIYNPKSIIKEPLILVALDKKFDISVKVKGGGKVAQVEAVRLGVARAIVSKDPKLKTTLKKAGFLTRDPRMKERKKYGLKRARKAPQFRKR